MSDWIPADDRVRGYLKQPCHICGAQANRPCRGFAGPVPSCRARGDGLVRGVVERPDADLDFPDYDPETAMEWLYGEERRDAAPVTAKDIEAFCRRAGAPDGTTVTRHADGFAISVPVTERPFLLVQERDEGEDDQ